MQWLAQICVRRPVFATVLMLIIVVLGIAGYSKLGLDQFPNVEFPFVVITTRLDGAAPEEVETDISDKIEGAVSTISGIDELRSTSSQGLSLVIIQFALEKNGDVAAQDVRDKIATILQDLPKGIDAPIVTKLDLGATPVLSIAVRGKRSIRDISEIADKQVRRQIESITGVGQVTVVGAQNRQLNVWLDPLALRAQGLTAVDVQRTIGAQNLTTPGGNVETGPDDFTLRLVGRVESPEALSRLILRERNGHAIRLEDVARVEDGTAEERSYAQLDNERTVILQVLKQSGTNTVDVVDAVKARLSQVEKSLPEGTKIEVVRDNSRVIRTGIAAVKEHLVLGAALAGLVVLLFLGNVRSTLIAAIAIPISIVGTFAAMWLAGFTLNFLTLLALALAVGIVIDDAIVVLENIVRFIEEKGMKPFPAAVLATREIGMAVLATTLSLMAVFIPVSFMPGIAGRFLRSFGLTMAFAIAVSLLVSFSLTPSLAARWLKSHPIGVVRKPSFLERGVEVFYRPIERVYMTVLRWIMGHRWVMVLACVLVMGSCVPIATSLPGGFLPVDDVAQFEINLRAPEGTSLTATRLVTERITDDVKRIPGVLHTLTTIGAGNTNAPNVVTVLVMLVDPDQRTQSQAEVMQRVRDEVLAKQPPEMHASAGEVQLIGGGGAANSAHIQVALQGPDLSKLSAHATHLTEAMRKVPGAVDIDNTFVVGKPQVRASVERDRAAALGVQVADVAGTLQLLVGGLKVSSYSEGGEEYDIRMRADAKYRADAASLMALTVPSSKLGSLALSNVISMKTETGPAEINRLGRRRVITVYGNAAPGVGDSSVQAALDKAVAEEHLEPGYSAAASGRSKDTANTGLAFLVVIGLAFVFMYLILAAQFESWLHPITILLSLPLTVPFALISLHLFHETLNLFSGLGLLVLFGVVKKNAILQIDHTNHLRTQGRNRLDAILEANKDRLRPILMTTIAFVAGMIPLVNSHGVGSGQNRTTGAIVLGGQSLSLALTLLAVPVAYSLFDDVAQWFRRISRGKSAEDKGEKELDTLLGLDPILADENAAAAAEEE